MSVKDIAASMGIEKNDVNYIIATAMKKLRTQSRFQHMREFQNEDINTSRRINSQTSRYSAIEKAEEYSGQTPGWGGQKELE